MSRLSAKSRAELAVALRTTLDILKSGQVGVHGDGHDLQKTIARLRERIAELEEAGR